MFIHRVNIFLLSVFIALSPAAVFANTAAVFGVASALPMQGAVRVLIADLAAQSSAAAAATMTVGTNAAVMGAYGAAIVAGGYAAYNVGYGVGTVLNNKYCLSDAVLAALTSYGYSCNATSIVKPLPDTVFDDGQYLYFSPGTNGNVPTSGNPVDINTFIAAVIVYANGLSTSDTDYHLKQMLYANGVSGPYSQVHVINGGGTEQHLGMNRITQSHTVNQSTIPVTNQELGNAILSSPAATNITASSIAMQRAVENTASVENCYKAGGTFDLNSMTCTPALNPTTGQPLSGLTDAQKDAKAAEISTARTAAYNAEADSIAKSLAASAAISDAAANPTDEQKQAAAAAAIAAATAAKTASSEANSKLTAVSVAATAEGFSIPSFCSWAVIVCDAIAWVKTEPVAPTDTAITVNSSMPSSVSAVDLNREYFNFGNQCPPDIPLNFNLMGQSVTASITYAHFCTFLIALKPFVISSAFIGAVYIVSGSNRSGGGD